jgi:hypothetical protein
MRARDQLLVANIDLVSGFLVKPFEAEKVRLKCCVVSFDGAPTGRLGHPHGARGNRTYRYFSRRPQQIV